MKPQITIQLYTVRELAGKDYDKTLRAIAAMGFGCVEPARYPGSTPEKALKLFQELGLKAPSAHIGLPVGEDKNSIIEEALMMGHRYLITGCPPGFKENYTSADRMKAMADLYCEAAQNVAPHGLQIGYHNHDWDLVEVEGIRAHEFFLNNTPETVLYEADTFWVARAGLDPDAFIRQLGPRGKVLHFKDGIVSGDVSFRAEKTNSGDVMVSDSIPFREAGVGQVDLIAASRAAQHAEYIAVELDSYDGDILQAIKDSYDYLTRNNIAVGNK